MDYDILLLQRRGRDIWFLAKELRVAPEFGHVNMSKAKLQSFCGTLC